MVWQGLSRRDAAQAAGLKEHALYCAFRKPHVKAHYLAECEVLRTSAKARNIHVLEQVRDQTGNQMARVNAVKAIEGLGDDEASVGRTQRAPGVVIVVQGDAQLSNHYPRNEAKSLTDKRGGSS